MTITAFTDNPTFTLEGSATLPGVAYLCPECRQSYPSTGREAAEQCCAQLKRRRNARIAALGREYKRLARRLEHILTQIENLGGEVIEQ